MDIKSKYIEVHIVRKQDNEYQFLALKRAADQVFPNLWQPVTGKIKMNEKAFEAALREVNEETGIVAKKIYIVPNISTFYLSESDAVYISPVFVIEIDHEIEIKICKEHCEYKWLSKEEAKNYYAWKCQKDNVDIIYSLFNEDKKLMKYSEINK